MKKYKCMAGILAVLLISTFFSTPSMGADGEQQSGNVSAKKYSKAEICKIIENNYNYAIRDIYEVKPSSKPPYKPGKLTQGYRIQALNRLNMIRQLAGLNTVNLDENYSEDAQYGAVILAAIGELTHHPVKPEHMSESFYNRAANATSKSNIYYRSHNANLIDAVDAFMDDSDVSNISVLGHRRWQLNPYMNKVGFGQSSNYVDEWVFDKSESNENYDYIAWPASGNFPSGTKAFMPHTAWSVSLNPDKYSTPSKFEVEVKLTRHSDGRVWKFSRDTLYPVTNSLYYNIDTGGYAVPNCIIFRPSNVSAYEGKYSVEILGISDKNGEPETISYEVNFFNQNNYPFEDVKVSDYFFDAVSWASENEIVSGIAKNRFEPESACSRAQAVTFLWGVSDKPQADETKGFKDIPTGAYYSSAVSWALQSGVTAGTGSYMFSPNEPCTRAQVLTLLWRAKGSPYSSASPYAFKDITKESYYYNAVTWALGKGITSGTTDSTFSPDEICSRAQIVTFLYRAYLNKE